MKKIRQKDWEKSPGSYLNYWPFRAQTDDVLMKMAGGRAGRWTRQTDRQTRRERRRRRPTMTLHEICAWVHSGIILKFLMIVHYTFLGYSLKHQTQRYTSESCSPVLVPLLPWRQVFKSSSICIMFIILALTSNSKVHLYTKANELDSELQTHRQTDRQTCKLQTVVSETMTTVTKVLDEWPYIDKTIGHSSLEWGGCCCC